MKSGNMIFTRDVEKNSVSMRLRKPYIGAEMTSHTVLTDDVFSYVDFYYKTHKRVVKNAEGKPVENKHTFYWEQAKNFYKAAKMLPIESAPLPMYYCILNAVKSYLFYNAKKYENIAANLTRHGLHECKEDENSSCSLDNIYVMRDSRGVFCELARSIDSSFDAKWPSGKPGKASIKELMYQLPFVHSAYVSTYSLPRKKEKFIPLLSGTCPTFKYSKDNKIRLVVDLDKRYFKQNATGIPEEIKKYIPSKLEANPGDDFQLVSSEAFKKKELVGVIDKYREMFSFISAEKRLWYLKKTKMDEEDLENINSMIIEMAIVHRFSEIVRYKPEQMTRLLSSKENWLIHEFLSLVLDQFMDEIACEITKQEIMPTGVKS